MDRPTLKLLVGIPGSGKSTFAKEYVNTHLNTIHLSSDSIRSELYGNESIQGDPTEVFSLMQNRAVEALNDGKDVVYDSTTMTRKDRAGIISVCPKFVKIECYIIWAPIEVCIERDAARERTVGKEVIDRMLKRFQAPFYDEGIDEINIIKPDNWDLYWRKYSSKCFDEMRIKHDNPHHSLDIIDHCWEAKEYMFNNNINDEVLCNAALLHDIGKPYVKAFFNTNGEPYEYAHYYQHQCVGAYMSYGFSYATPKMSWLISTHMDPFFNSKYYLHLSPYLKRDLDILHKADVNSH